MAQRWLPFPLVSIGWLCLLLCWFLYLINRQFFAAEKHNNLEETVNGRQDVRDRREQAVNLWNHHVIARSGHKKPKSDHMETEPSLTLTHCL